MYFYVQHVMIPYQLAQAASLRTPRGNLSDLYPRWLGARELLLHHRDPYSENVTREIQAGYYGREIHPGQANEPTDEQGFAYPVYVVFLLAPTIGLPFPAVQTAFFWFLVALAVTTVLLWIGFLDWRISWVATVAIVVLTLGSFPAIQGLKLEQLSLLVAGLIAAALFLIGKNHLFAAGILLACATIKPQLVLPLAAWLFLWSAAELKSRQNFLWGFLATLAALITAGEYVLPGWISEFQQAVGAYRRYTGGAESIIEVLGGAWWGKLVIAAGLAIFCWQARHTSAKSTRFHWITALCLATTVVIVPKTAPYNQLLLLPGILFLVIHREGFYASAARRTAALVTAVCVAWPWLAALALTVASIVMPSQTVQKAWPLPLYTTLAIPLTVTLLLALCYRLPRRANSPQD